MGNVKQREHADEAGSTGMLWLDLMLADRSWVSVGNIYSECDNKTSLMGLKMKDVWEARGKTITGILAEDDKRRLASRQGRAKGLRGTVPGHAG